MRNAWIAGLAATTVFWLMLLTFQTLDPTYDAGRQAVSELGAIGAPRALAWNLLGFIGVGLLISAFGAGLWPRAKIAGRILTVLIAGSGLAFAATGVFPADMKDWGSFTTRAHILASQISFFLWLPALIVAMIAARSRTLPGLGWTSLAGLILALAAMSTREMDGIENGVAQRLTFAAYFAWIAAVSILGLRRRRAD